MTSPKERVSTVVSHLSTTTSSRPHYVKVILDDIKNHHVEYPLTNHVVSGTVALHGLGRDDLIDDWYKSYATRLKKPVPEEVQDLSPAQFQALLGKGTHWRSLSAYCERCLQSPEALNGLLDILIPSEACAAFHGLINTGWGLRIRDHPTIAAHGLGYWAMSYSNLSAPRSRGSKRLHELFNTIQELKDDKTMQKFKTLREDGFEERFIRVLSEEASFEKYDLVLEEKEVSSDTAVDQIMRQILQGTANLFCGTGGRDFFLLHAITSADALRVLLGFVSSLPIRARLIRAFWRHVLMAYIAQRMPAYTPPKVLSQLRDWEHYVRLSVPFDEHLVKLAFLAKEEKDLLGQIGFIQTAMDMAVEEIVRKKQGFIF